MDVTGYIRPTKACPEQSQREALAAAGVQTVYCEGEDAETLAEAIRRLRKGSRIAVAHAWLLAEPRKSTRDRPRDTLFAALKTIAARGAIVWELATGRTTATDSLDITRDAVEWLSGQARGRKGAINGKRGGRPPIDWSQWRDAMERDWTSTRHGTNAAAVAAMQRRGVPVRDVRQAMYVLGASGRGK